MSYEVNLRFTTLYGVEGGAIRAIVTDTNTGREVTNQTYIHRPIVTAENLKDEIMFAAKELCGVKETKKPAQKKSTPGVATITKETKKDE